MKITQPVTSLCIITFQKSFIDLKSTQNIALKYLGLYVKHCLHTSKCSFSYFHYYMLQNKQSTAIDTHYTVGCVICISNKVKYLDKERNFSQISANFHSRFPH